MKIFLSWSGQRSLGVATALREWLPLLFQNIQLFVSSEDIRKGKRWPAEVGKELETSNFGIVCLMPDNLEAPWLLFEAGALSKSVKEASVYTLLSGGLRISDIEGPLSHFQHTVFEREDFFKLVTSINEAQGQEKQDNARLRKVFDKFWEELETSVAKATKVDANAKPEKKRSSDEMLRELLEITNHIARNIPEIRESKIHNSALLTRPVIVQDEFLKPLLDKIGKHSKFVRSYLLEIGYIAFNPKNSILTMSYRPGFEDHVGLVDNAKVKSIILQALSEMGIRAKNVIFNVMPSTVPDPDL